MTFVSITLIVKAVDIRGRDPNIEYEDSIYVDTALITLSAIYKTILWFLILMVSLGWKISIQSLRREDLKFFMKMADNNIDLRIKIIITHVERSLETCLLILSAHITDMSDQIV